VWTAPQVPAAAGAHNPCMPAGDAPIRVLVADDHPIVRGGLIALLDSLDGIRVVGQAGTGREAVAGAVSLCPDVVVMDLRMPDLDGVAATAQIRSRAPAVAVLVLTMFDEDALVTRALAAGARGYVLKGAESADIERALRTVASGHTVLSRSVADQVFGRVGAPPVVRPLAGLTPREDEVLDLIARGLGNTAIADRLHLAPKTVGNHISAIFAKLGVSTRAEAIVRARDAGLGSDRPAP
jgi:DNA-binding NarL/FixJ family response regulator